MEIFRQTGGDDWNNHTHWGNDSVPHCFWYGITCEHTNRYIISIYLANNSLIGTLPRSLWKLRNLQGLCIDYNKGLLGHPGEILSANMTSLLRVDLAFNHLSGQIPGEILAKMKSLVKIQLCCQTGEGLTGEIPKDIGNLTELQVLSIGENRLYGSIPKSIENLQKLWFLDLKTATNLRDGFENLLKLSSLSYMCISNAGLYGSLPDDFGLRFPELIECSLNGNHFTGRIPSTMDQLKNLGILSLARNHFSGQIPKNIGSLPRLINADFSENQLSSFQKGTEFTCQSLEVLLLANNKQLTMSLNAVIEMLKSTKRSLRIFNISDCRFFGFIPAKLWTFKNLISVDLTHNRLIGEIPWSSLPPLFLHDVYLSANNLSGEVSQFFASVQSLQFLDISKNPHMHESDKGGEFKYITVDFSTLTRRNPSDKFKCPNARLKYRKGLVILDPHYYFHRLCICDIGYYGSGKTCLPCMSGAVCEDQTLPAQSMAIKEGYWPSSRDQNVTHLVECAHALGTNPLVKTSCNPTGTCNCWIEWMKVGDNKMGGPSTVCNKSCICLTGSKDRFCSLCEDGYYKQGILCYACPKSEIDGYVLAALVVLTMVLLILAFILYERKRFLSIVLLSSQFTLLTVLAMLHFVPGWLLELNIIFLFVALAAKGKATRGILKISLFYFQTLDALISNNDNWPAEVFETQRYISNVFNFRFSGLACVMPSLFTPLGELVSLMLLPVICIFGIWLYYGLGHLACIVFRLRNVTERRYRLRNFCLQLSIMSLNLIYFPIVKKTASVLGHCGVDNNHHYLIAAPWMECNGHVYTTLQVLGWLALVMYVFGVPFGLLLPLLRKYNVARRDQLLPQERETLDSWLGSLYLPYKKEFRSYFQIWLIVRRMLVAFALSLITRASSFQTIAVCFVLQVSLCFQLFFRPFIDSFQWIPLENTMEALVLLTLHFSFMNSRYAVLNPESSDSILWMLVSVNLVLLCGIVVSITVVLGKKNPEEVQLELHETIANEERRPFFHTNSPSATLVRNGPEAEQYGTFEDSQSEQRSAEENCIWAQTENPAYFEEQPTPDERN